MSFFLLLLLAACSPTSLKDLRMEGEAETKKLALELRKIETKESLIRASPKLKKRFNRIADLLIQTHEFEELLPERKEFPRSGKDRDCVELPVQKGEILKEPSLASEELFIELARLYEIPGAKEIVEGAQKEAVAKLNSSDIK